MQSQRFMNIDALRAIAAISVLIQHFFGDVLRHAADPLAPLVPAFRLSIENFDLGRFGVILFFLISGFVVPFSIRGSQPLRRFAISRFFRLYPPLWLAILLLSLLAVLEGTPRSIMSILSNLTMLPSFFGQTWLSGIYWTLSIEIIFYILSAFLFAGGLLYRPVAVTIFSLMLIASTFGPILIRMTAGLSLPIQYIGLHVSFLFCGLLLRMALVDKLKWAGFGACLVVLAQFAALFSIGDFSLDRGDTFFMVGKATTINGYIAAFAVFILSVKSGKPQSDTLSYLGAISYSIYLYHGIVALAVYPYFPLTGGYRDLPVGLFCAALTLMISALVYQKLEKPMIAAGKRVADGKKTRFADEVI